jgi:O-antigen/teichoic acid export membrane protein
MLLVLGFNMGWTPYFLKIGKQKDAPIIFARVATYFLGISGFFIVIISLWIDYVVRINIGNVTVFGSEFWSSTRVVPLILLGYYFSGLFVLQLPGVFILNKTKWMPIMRGSGAIVSITANLILIPIFDITGAAMAKALAYFCMATAIYIMTRNIYPIPFRPRSILFPIVFMLIIIAVPLSNELRLLITILYPVLWFLLVAEKTDIEKIKSLYRKK